MRPSFEGRVGKSRALALYFYALVCGGKLKQQEQQWKYRLFGSNRRFGNKLVLSPKILLFFLAFARGPENGAGAPFRTRPLGMFFS